uniref:Uncharacterized protein n=1 Tax=Lepeophtheirus salmonis TaxID=72036 RepID=A0A0K2VBH9_LEPSM
MVFCQYGPFTLHNILLPFQNEYMPGIIFQLSSSFFSLCSLTTRLRRMVGGSTF